MDKVYLLINGKIKVNISNLNNIELKGVVKQLQSQSHNSNYDLKIVRYYN